MRSAGARFFKRPFQHLGAADHVLEGGHGVLPLRLFVGDRRVEVVVAGLRDQQGRLGRVAARRRGVVQPAQQRRRRHDRHHQVLAVANRQHQPQQRMRKLRRGVEFLFLKFVMREDGRLRHAKVKPRMEMVAQARPCPTSHGVTPDRTKLGIRE